MTNKQLKKFFNDRPAISLNQIADEAGMGRRTLHYKLTEERRITEEQEQKLLPVLRKYGWRRYG